MAEKKKSCFCLKTKTVFSQYKFHDFCIFFQNMHILNTQKGGRYLWITTTITALTTIRTGTNSRIKSRIKSKIRKPTQSRTTKTTIRTAMKKNISSKSVSLTYKRDCICSPFYMLQTADCRALPCFYFHRKYTFIFGLFLFYFCNQYFGSIYRKLFHRYRYRIEHRI